MICFPVTIRTNVSPHLKPGVAAVCPMLRRKCVPTGGCLVSELAVGVPCKFCGSVNQSKFKGEMGIHFSGLKNIDKPVVWVFPELVVCLDCGSAEFAVPEAKLRVLAKGGAHPSG